MTYCESGQRECIYLDYIHELKDSAILARATEEEGWAALAGHVEESIDELNQEAASSCGTTQCGLEITAIKKGIDRAITEIAERNHG